MSHSEAALTPDIVVNDDVRAWIGRSTDLVELPDEIGGSDIRRYVEATGDRNPLWLDDTAARAAGYRSRVVPPACLIEMVWRLKGSEGGKMTDRVPLPASYVDTRNVDNDIEWLEPVYIGDRISLRHRIRDIVARESRRGIGVYITRETEYVRSDGRLMARVTQTVARFPKASSEGA